MIVGIRLAIFFQHFSVIFAMFCFNTQESTALRSMGPFIEDSLWFLEVKSEKEIIPLDVADYW